MRHHHNDSQQSCRPFNGVSLCSPWGSALTRRPRQSATRIRPPSAGNLPRDQVSRLRSPLPQTLLCLLCLFMKPPFVCDEMLTPCAGGVGTAGMNRGRQVHDTSAHGRSIIPSYLPTCPQELPLHPCFVIIPPKHQCLCFGLCLSQQRNVLELFPPCHLLPCDS